MEYSGNTTRTEQPPSPNDFTVVEMYVKCNCCQKRRVVSSNRPLTSDEMLELRQRWEDYYRCGSSLILEEYPMSGLCKAISMNRDLTCHSSMEDKYYQHPKFPKDVCKCCGKRGARGEREVDEEIDMKLNHWKLYSVHSQCADNLINKLKSTATATATATTQERINVI
ncbi:uncharacterized protein LOC141903957 [Tubulanus polymorphus]|uniref:uncharacterized protein LOC141903957 n=1 Tax=Tubulanus polymorphus TaxID=672921 RepID=UPI003DA35935